MLTTPANNATENATNATNTLLATNTPGNTGGLLAASRVGGVLAAGDESRARTGVASSLIDRMTAEAQAARDATDFNAGTLNGKRFVIREDWTAVADRAAAKFGRAAAVDEALRFARAKRIADNGRESARAMK